MDCPYTQGPKEGRVLPGVLERTAKHPCFSHEARRKHARMHLPVAPRCNISCNYCNRKFDCLHESRPGVTSEVLTPASALAKFQLARGKVENLSVVGIAGPGDALADWENTKKTIELIKGCDSGIIFCLSTNGLLLPDYAGEITGLGVDHVTVTVNCLDPAIGGKIYKYINYRGRRYEGAKGAAILISNQLAGIEYLVGHGAVVKVNIILIKGLNDNHIPDVVKKVGDLGAFISNIMPLIPVEGSAFAAYPRPSLQELNQLRDICRADLRQMYHCRQCRADAVGLLADDRSREFYPAAAKKATA